MDVSIVELPLAERFKISSGSWDVTRNVFVVVRREGLAGIGEVEPDDRAQGTAESVAEALEHEIKRRELSRTTCRRSTLFGRGPPSDPRVDRTLHGQCAYFGRGCDYRRFAGTWWNECAIYLGRNTARQNKLANLRLDVAGS